ncbi:hypothetical protein CR513_32057, partial [Mucuna pruriens]
MSAQGNSPSLEDPMKQLAASNLEFQQTMSSSNMKFQQNMNATIQDLKTQIGQSGKELPQPALQQLARSTNINSEPYANSQVPQQDKTVPFLFPTRTLNTRKPKFDEELLRMLRKVEINIPLLDAIKQIPK